VVAPEVRSEARVDCTMLREDLDILSRVSGTVGMVSDVPRRYGFADWIGEFRKTPALIEAR